MQPTTKKQVGSSMLKLLTNKEQLAVSGGQRGPVPPPGNTCSNTGNGGSRPCVGG
ncbi:hypothetical protein HNQ99_003262 [Rhizorhapis suberifaciens]|uniref:Uncharacterized protein n=1 Tax=Rhizorhapis suberifaciens TaxID=13656 RepID=A0A840HXU6_9SPHN|nr:hypothetical protein [Rhizorhapis suberifaciens]